MIRWVLKQLTSSIPTGRKIHQDYYSYNKFDLIYNILVTYSPYLKTTRLIKWCLIIIQRIDYFSSMINQVVSTLTTIKVLVFIKTIHLNSYLYIMYYFYLHVYLINAFSLLKKVGSRHRIKVWLFTIGWVLYQKPISITTNRVKCSLKPYMLKYF